MTAHRATTTRSRIAVEDILLAVLGLIAGPLLWWMGQTWQQLPAASSTQTLEYWIATICGLLGVGLCVMWLVFLIAGLGMVIGLKTRNAAVTYWSEIFTPTVLRRVIISIFGAQLALASQAVAASAETPDATPVEQPEPFMPYVHEPITQSSESAPESASTTSDDPQPNQASSEPIHTSDGKLSASETKTPGPFPEPRQDSDITVTPTPSASSSSNELVPTPRETSSFEVETKTESRSKTSPESLRQIFVPQQPVPSPYIGAPNQARISEDPTVVIKAGDCLWDIAHHELGAEATLFQIDQRWRQWWEHNRAAIGDDPHALEPGTVLQSPPFTE